MRNHLIKNEVEIEEAQSMKNGIVFYSMRNEGMRIVTTIDKSNCINTKIVTQKDLKEEFNIKQFMVYWLVEMIPTTIIITFLIMDKYFSAEWKTSLCILYPAIMELWEFFVWRPEEESKRFHAAEHMVINAYADLDRIPDIVEIRQYSRFHNQCGTNITTRRVIYILLFWIMLFTPITILGAIILFLLGRKIIKWLFSKGYLNFLQRFTTSEPTDKELMVAIEGMRAFIEYEQQQTTVL